MSVVLDDELILSRDVAVQKYRYSHQMSIIDLMVIIIEGRQGIRDEEQVKKIDYLNQHLILTGDCAHSNFIQQKV